MEPKLFFFVLGVAVLETILSATWNRFYFSVGLPLFRREAAVFSPSAPLPTCEQLRERLRHSPFPSLVFRSLGADTFAFRERAWGEFFRFSYSPVMHGRLIFDRSGASVRVIGLANWFTLAFFSFVTVTLLSWPRSSWFFFPFLFAVLGAIYAIQAKRFGQVLVAAAAEWSADSAVT